jgi:hypothetical protein
MAKPFMWSNEMSKVLIDIGYKKYVVEADEALKIAAMLSKAEQYETRYVKDDKGDGVSVHYIYPQDDMRWLMEIMPDNIYRMAKLAGKPNKD